MPPFRRVVGYVAAAAFLIGLAPGLVAAGSGVGAALQLGVTNTVNVATKLAAATAGSAFQISNTGAGPGLQITVASGKAPIYVTPGAGKATNLNSDMLDGKDSSAFQGKITQLTDLNGIGCGSAGQMLLATSAITCVADGLEPNDTQGTAGLATVPSTQQALVGAGDVDWFTVVNPTCGVPPGQTDTACVLNVGLDTVNVRMDVYFGATLKASNVKTYGGQFDFYTGAQPTYTIRVHSVNKEPYKISFG